ncbi:MAG: spore maturation protein [Clostridia bacterium]|nr:spore maturation protein [Clostridia bacterium]
MAQIGAAAVCVLVTVVVFFGFIKDLPVFDLFVEGAKDGLRTAIQLLPTLIGLITAITMLRASGVLDMMTHMLEPLLGVIGVPADLIPLMLIRPLSGSGAVAYVTELYTVYGAESDVGKMAAILSSATETTFYAAAVYFAGRGYKSMGYTIPAALCGDLTASVLAVLSVRLFG